MSKLTQGPEYCTAHKYGSGGGYLKERGEQEGQMSKVDAQHTAPVRDKVTEFERQQ